MGPTKSTYPGYSESPGKGAPRARIPHATRAGRHYHQGDPQKGDWPATRGNGHPPPGKRHEEELEVGQWRIDEDPTGEPTGHIELLTTSQEQARCVQHALTNVAVEVHKKVTPLQVTGDALVAGTFRRP